MTTTPTALRPPRTIARTTARLRSRARRLRSQADTVLDPVAVAYRRRAAELELQAVVLDGLVLDREAELPSCDLAHCEAA